MLFFWIKILHVISSAILLGTGLGTAFYMFCVNQQKNIKLIAGVTKQVVFVDWIFTGMMLLGIKGYSPFLPWVVFSVVGYVIAAFYWFVVVYLQIRCRDLAFDAFQNNAPLSEQYYRCYRWWWIVSIPTFLSLMGVFYLMVNK